MSDNSFAAEAAQAAQTAATVATQEETKGQSPRNSQEPKKGLAITGLVLGIIGFLLAFVIGTGLPVAISAVVISSIVLAKRRPGKGMAIAGVILGGLGVIISIIAIIIFAVMMNNVRQELERESSSSSYTVRAGNDSIARQNSDAVSTQKKVTNQMKDRYDQIKTGMSKDQVRSLTGEPLHIRNGVSSKTGTKVEVYLYPTGAPSSTKANKQYYVVFQDGSVIAKFDTDQLRSNPSLGEYIQ